MGCKFAQHGITDFSENQYRISVIHQLGRLPAPNAIGSIVRKDSRAPFIRRGGLTGLANDKAFEEANQDKALKEVYRSEEPKALVRRIMQAPNGARG